MSAGAAKSIFSCFTQRAQKSSSPTQFQQASQSPGYPWSARQLALLPPLLLDDHRATEPSPPPFPRYGLSVATTLNGELYLFGGLVGETARNELYLIQAIGDLSSTLIQTSGDIPSPRVGHASVIVTTDLIVWGGDTDTDQELRWQGDKKDERDDGLYLLNLQTKEWNRVAASGPACRYGHTMTVVDNSKCIIFGGQGDGKFFNDLWSFDLNSLRPRWKLSEPEAPEKPAQRINDVSIKHEGHIVTSSQQLSQASSVSTRVDSSIDEDVPPAYTPVPNPYKGEETLEYGPTRPIRSASLSSLQRWESIEPTSPERPAQRTGHVCINHRDRIIIFGGTDGQYHYNDTWSFDLTTRKWSELACIGYIPAPREGHAAALVDDIMYVFGGRGVDGNALNDLAAFKLSNQRWFMFRNMGPAPSGGSGHAMASFGDQVFVLGGESLTPTKPEEANCVHVLDTKLIKYPDANISRVVQNSSGPIQDQQPSQLSTAHPTYPWSVHRLDLLPPLLDATPATDSSPPPFPRYGHALPATATRDGTLYLFGGLVRETARNDLYLLHARELSATLLQTAGEIPSPRVGHASAIVSNVLIVWGGDTKTDPISRQDDKQDDGLYLMNLQSKKWTRVTVSGPSPVGRYGHAVTMAHTSKFIIFGGQVDGEFLNDLWSFDLNSLRSRPQWELMEPTSPERPAQRLGHVCINHGDRIIIFGGSDGQYHYNDTWSFDLTTRQWSELTCIGFIPAPREGHAAALVDDVMYIFGGRGVDGKDLNDLAAFKLSNQRWYMFQNMGPAPSGRSGHAMASFGDQVFVLGGESFTPTKPEEANYVHVLDTKHIKYPNTKSAQKVA